jgi:hypothetical protein
MLLTSLAAKPMGLQVVDSCSDKTQNLPAAILHFPNRQAQHAYQLLLASLWDRLNDNSVIAGDTAAAIAFSRITWNPG